MRHELWRNEREADLQAIEFDYILFLIWSNFSHCLNSFLFAIIFRFTCSSLFLGLYTQGKDVTKYATMLKLKAGRLSREIPDACLQYWGGMGYSDIPISRMFRDFRLMSIGGGADEVMLSIICKFMGTLPAPWFFCMSFSTNRARLTWEQFLGTRAIRSTLF